MSDGKWKKGQSGNNKGRKYKSIGQWLKDLSKCHDIQVDITKKYLTEDGNEQIKREFLSLSSNEPSKTVNAIVASQLIAGAMEGNLNYIKEFLNRMEENSGENSDTKPDVAPPLITFTITDNAKG